MSEFWLWFWRPIAEILGVLAVIAGLCLLSLVTLLIGGLWRRAKRWVGRRFG